ncbi:MAG: hypothetical protein RLZZ577_18 [Bacteroidota bacterium]|jgi:glycosyltransferase involved in cell wall biosynthesis
MISILLAVYNGADFVEEAINSVIEQTYSNWELIVVDNGSTDNTYEIIQKMANCDDRIRNFQLTEKGKVKAYNYSFEKAKGDYICFFAADDKLTPNSLEIRVTPIFNRQMGFSTCLLKTFSKINEYNGVVFPKKINQPNYSGGSIMFTKILANMIFPIPEEQPNEDTWTSLHLRAFGENVHIPQVLYQYRIHVNNSFGYGLNFNEKRSRYLKRMNAFNLFYERYKANKTPFIHNEVVPFLMGLDFAKQNQRFKILLISNLDIRSKMVLYFYCSPFLFNLRYKYFKILSGIIN